MLYLAMKGIKPVFLKGPQRFLLCLAPKIGNCVGIDGAHCLQGVAQLSKLNNVTKGDGVQQH